MTKRLIGLFVLSLMLVFAGLARAQDLCNAMVFDGAHVFGSDLDKVSVFGKKLVSLGADLRVRMVKSLEGEATVDGLEKNFEQNCASWRNPTGARKSNLIVLIAVAGPPKKAGIFYGSQWNASLGANANWTRVLADVMAPRFRDDDWAGGMVLGLNEISRLVDAQVHPQAPGTTVIHAAPTDYSGLWAVLKIVMALITLVIVILLLFVILRIRTARRVARQKALLVKDSVASRITSFDTEVNQLEDRVDELSEMLAGEDAMASMRAMMSEMKRYYGASVSRYRDLEGVGCDPMGSGLSAREYDEITKNYSEVLDQLMRVETTKNQMNEKMTELAKIKGAAEKAIADDSKTLEEVERRIKIIREAGFKTPDADVSFVSAQKKLADAAALCGEKHFSEALAGSTTAQKYLIQAMEAAQQALKFKIIINDKTVALKDRIEAVKQVITEGHLAMERVKKTYAAASYESIIGNVVEATNRVNWSLQSLKDAVFAGSMEKQEWVAADACVQNTEKWLSEAESLVRSIGAREKNLTQAAEDAPRGVIAAAKDIQEAREYILQYDDDIRDMLEDDLNQADNILEYARKELQVILPDYPKALKLIQQAHGAADNILLEAKAEHEAADRLRAKAADGLRDAKRAISKAEEYINDHHNHRVLAATIYLDQAKLSMKEAEQTLSLEDRIAFAKKAKKDAEEAYEAIKNRVMEVRSTSTRNSEGGGRAWGRYAPAYHDTTLIVVNNTNEVRQQESYTAPAADEWRPSGGESMDIVSDSGGGGSMDVSSDSGGGGSIDI